MIAGSKKRKRRVVSDEDDDDEWQADDEGLDGDEGENDTFIYARWFYVLRPGAVC